MIKTTVTRNILIISLIMILILTAFSLELFATTTGDPVENPDFYKPNTATNTAPDSRITTRAGNILGIINVVGVVVSVITLGYRYKVYVWICRRKGRIQTNSNDIYNRSNINFLSNNNT